MSASGERTSAPGASTAVRPDVSVVLPVHNEAGHIRAEVDRIRAALDASPYSYELILIDDGSTDESAQEIATIDDVQVIRFPVNRGSGSARKVGTRAARGRLVAWTDVDMSYPNDEIPSLVKELDQGFDQVVGARRTEQGTKRAARVPAKWLLRRLASYLTDTRIPDLNSGLRVFRRDVALQYLYLLPRGFSCVTTITMAFLANGYSVRYVPIDYFPRAGRSKFHWWVDTRRYLLQIVRMVLVYNPLRVFMPPSLLLLVAGVGKLAYDLVANSFHVAADTIVLLLVGVALGLLGLVADLVLTLNKPRDEVDPAAL
ncbi:MAG TPA: glycosyltransferase family 2 protein [Acidimicrobiales bacterium]|nr:glycosyltransferase family 2 protein [Acidimicrobiales bacterium]